MKFKVKSEFDPTPAQRDAVSDVVSNFTHQNHNTLLGVTGSGKTFVMSKIIEEIQRPTLIITHNKTLVAQLYEEFKAFFPDNLVEYYVSHFDYFRPESYLPVTDTYIAKETQINDELERLKVKAVSSLLSGRKDVIVIASISAIFGAGNPKFFHDKTFTLEVGQNISFTKVLKMLVDALYSRKMSLQDTSRGTFVVKGDTIFIRLGQTKETYRVTFWGDEIEEICLLKEDKSIERNQDKLTITPTSIFVMPKTSDEVFDEMTSDMERQVQAFRDRGLEIEAKRLEDRTKYDIEMMRELGWTQGIENYSSYFDRRKPGERARCLLDYFPMDDYMIMLDESHATLPQLKGMHKGATSTKRNLVEYGFRLASALNNRPLTYEEFDSITDKILYVSATPSEFELQKSEGVVTELLVRPTGILDPKIDVRPLKHCVDDLIEEIVATVENGLRVIVTTISKRQAEDLSYYLSKLNINSRYLHGDIETLDRIELLHDLRAGDIDVIVGINLLREGLDLPEVGLVAIMDADKEGFLRNYTSMAQVIGRAARNVEGRAIMYADNKTGSIRTTIKQNEHNRKVQQEYNKKHGIVPKQIKKSLKRITASKKLNEKKRDIAVDFIEQRFDLSTKTTEELRDLHIEVKRKMKEHSKKLEFIEAAMYRDAMFKIEELLK
jgi:excinuclease ABC subunit B